VRAYSFFCLQALPVPCVSNFVTIMTIFYDGLRYVLTAIYLLIIQYLTRLGGKVSVKLINREINESVEYRANSLIYKVFGLYFMQTYIGIFYHVLLHRNFMTLRQVLIQRLIISQVKEGRCCDKNFPLRMLLPAYV
jgi:anoctamin-10